MFQPEHIEILKIVFQAIDRKTSQDVAVKIINISPSEEALLKRIEREIKILTSLSHPHVVGCIGAGSLPDGRPYLVLEWLATMPQGPAAR